MLNSKTSFAVACFLPSRVKDLSAPLYMLNVWWLQNKIEEKSVYPYENSEVIDITADFKA